MTNESVILETERLALRRITLDDLASLLAIWSDPKTMIHYPKPLDRADAERWIEHTLRTYEERGYGLYAMILKETGDVVGDCGFFIQEVDGRTETELGYHIAQSWWNRGYATEAARACRDYAFDQLGLSRLISLIRPVNLQSRRVAEKAGMTIEKETQFRGLQHYVYSIASKSF